MAHTASKSALAFVLTLSLPSLGSLLTACSGSDRPAAQETSTPNPSNSASPFACPSETSGGGYFVVVTPHPEPIPINAVFSLDVTVYKDRGLSQPASGVTVQVDAGMPAHNHGMNLTPRVARAGDGRFRVEGMLMHMPGAWEVYVDVLEGGKAERAKFEVQVR